MDIWFGWHQKQLLCSDHSQSGPLTSSVPLVLIQWLFPLKLWEFSNAQQEDRRLWDGSRRFTSYILPRTRVSLSFVNQNIFCRRGASHLQETAWEPLRLLRLYRAVCPLSVLLLVIQVIYHNWLKCAGLSPCMWNMRWSDCSASGGRLFSSAAHGNIFPWPGLYHHLDVLRVPCFAWRDSPASGVFPTTFGLRAKHLWGDLSACVMCWNEKSLDLKCNWMILVYVLIKQNTASFSRAACYRMQLTVCSCQVLTSTEWYFPAAYTYQLPASCARDAPRQSLHFFNRPFIQSYSRIMKSCFSCPRQWCPVHGLFTALLSWLEAFWGDAT